MNRQALISVVFLGAYAFGLSSPAISAEKLPPSCAQLVRVYEVCKKEYLGFVELKQPQLLSDPQFMSKFEQLDAVHTMFAEAVRKGKGPELAIACAKPDMKGQYVQFGSNLATGVGLMGGASTMMGCAKVINQVQ